MDLAALGANVVLHGRNEENLKKVAEKCKEAGATEEKVGLHSYTLSSMTGNDHVKQRWAILIPESESITC